MIKLSFSGFNFKTDGIISSARIIATIKWFDGHKWFNVAYKEFKTKVTLKPNEVPDLNKAYKYIKAKLEKDAYIWANSEAKKEFNDTKDKLAIFDSFIDKSNHIISHNTEYLKNF